MSKLNRNIIGENGSKLLKGLIILFLMTGLSARISTEDLGHWYIETVDSAGDVGELSSIAIDSYDNPHVIYRDKTNNNLKYARWIGTSWDIQTVDSIKPGGYSNSIALDSNNNPHISCYDLNDYELKYIRWTGSSWAIQRVDPKWQTGHYCSIALDSNDYPHISYDDWSWGRLKYARWTGSSWDIQELDSPPDPYSGAIYGSISIALDGNEYPYISYRDNHYGVLKCARWIGASWDIQTVDSGGKIGSLALDINGYPHISYFVETSLWQGEIRYARLTGSGWDITIVYSADYLGGNCSIALDRNDYAHISFCGNPSSDPSFDERDLRYARWTGTGWDIKIVDSPVGEWIVNCSLALDKKDCPHISYYGLTDMDLKYARGPTQIDDLLGTWSTGVWYLNSTTGAWIKMSTPANLVAAGDLDGDGMDDLIGVWSSGLWVKYSSTHTWVKLAAAIPTDIASGDMNSDGRDDVLGTWASGVWFRDSLTGSWYLLSTSAIAVTAGDIDGDSEDDLIGVWNSGLWVKYSSTSSWALITPVLPSDIASGDMNGDGRDDILGTWPSGVWYWCPVCSVWVKMSTPAYLVAAGDMDEDGADDLIGTWSSGLWVKNSSTSTWQFICTSLPSDIDAGLFRTGWSAGAISYDAPVVGVYAEGPGDIDGYIDLTSEAPGGWNFVYREEKNLFPREQRKLEIMRIPGPGESGFKYTEQKNLFPIEGMKTKREKKRK